MISSQRVTVDQLWEKHGDMIPSSNPWCRWTFMIRAEKLKCRRGHGPRICHEWDGSFPVQVAARVPYYADWELRVSRYLGGDDKRNRQLYCEDGRCIALTPKAAWSKEITSHKDFPLAITWMVPCREDLLLLGILAPGDTSFHRSSMVQLNARPISHGDDSIQDSSTRLVRARTNQLQWQPLLSKRQ